MVIVWYSPWVCCGWFLRQNAGKSCNADLVMVCLWKGLTGSSGKSLERLATQILSLFVVGALPMVPWAERRQSLQRRSCLCLSWMRSRWLHVQIHVRILSQFGVAAFSSICSINLSEVPLYVRATCFRNPDIPNNFPNSSRRANRTSIVIAKSLTFFLRIIGRGTFQLRAALCRRWCCRCWSGLQVLMRAVGSTISFWHSRTLGHLRDRSLAWHWHALSPIYSAPPM